MEGKTHSNHLNTPILNSHSVIVWLCYVPLSNSVDTNTVHVSPLFKILLNAKLLKLTQKTPLAQSLWKESDSDNKWSRGCSRFSSLHLYSDTWRCTDAVAEKYVSRHRRNSFRKTYSSHCEARSCVLCGIDNAQKKINKMERDARKPRLRLWFFNPSFCDQIWLIPSQKSLCIPTCTWITLKWQV